MYLDTEHDPAMVSSEEDQGQEDSFEGSEEPDLDSNAERDVLWSVSPLRNSRRPYWRCSRPAYHSLLPMTIYIFALCVALGDLCGRDPATDPDAESLSLPVSLAPGPAQPCLRAEIPVAQLGRS